jgi:aspartate/tyrosine/aromatic aminotransferase
MATAATPASIFALTKELPPDAIFHTKARFVADTNPKKVNLGIGAYRTDDGKPYVLRVVDKAEKAIIGDDTRDMEYRPIDGDKEFVRLAQELVFGAKAVAEGRIAGAQTLSGTGSLRVLFAFMKTQFPEATVYYSNPTWGNHKTILDHAGFKHGSYRYWDPKTRGLDFVGMVDDLGKFAPGSIILLHACAHNPTGVDPTEEQWKAIAAVMKERGLIPFFDSAYQGFATGSFDNDAFAVRHFYESGFSFPLAYSFAKNMGLYGQRIGCGSVVTQSPKEAKAVQTQLCGIIRPMYSNPPKHGADIVKFVLGTAKEDWFAEVSVMSKRIIDMRSALRGKLEELKAPGTWEHITSQIGMFSFTGLTPEQCDLMASRWSIYMLRSGRISMAGVNTKNVEYIAEAMNDVLTKPEAAK